jgi:hypothetical protein
MHEIRFRVRKGRELFNFPHLPDWDIEDYDRFTSLVRRGGTIEEFTNFVTATGNDDIYENDKIRVGFHFDGDYSHKEYIGTVTRGEGGEWWVNSDTDYGDSLFDVVYNYGGESIDKISDANVRSQ